MKFSKSYIAWLKRKRIEIGLEFLYRNKFNIFKVILISMLTYITVKLIDKNERL